MQIHEPVLQWVLVSNERHHISEYARLAPEQRPDMVCPICHQPVIAKLGNTLIYHVAHLPGSVCPATQAETILHFNAKYHIYNELQKTHLLRILQSCSGVKKGLQTKTCEYKRAITIMEDWDDVQLEYKIGCYVGDVVLLRKNKIALVIEIKVTHPVGEEKWRFFKEKGIRSLEVEVKDTGFYEGDNKWQFMKPIPFLRTILPMLEEYQCEFCKQRSSPSWRTDSQNSDIVHTASQRQDAFQEMRPEQRKFEKARICEFCGEITKEFWYTVGHDRCRCNKCKDKGIQFPKDIKGK